MGCGNPIKKVKKEFDRFLDRRVGIDDKGTREAISFSVGVIDLERDAKFADKVLDDVLGIDHAGTRQDVIVGTAAVVGAVVGGGIGGAAGGAVGGALGGSAGAAAGTTAGVQLGVVVGAGAGAALAAKSLDHNSNVQPLDPLTPFSLPTNFELTSARSELQSVLRKKRARSRTDFTGGRLPSAQVTAPRLKTV